MSKTAPGVRYAEVERETRETRIRVVLDLDEGHRIDVSTGIEFFDHMLQQLAFHGQMNLGISADGDLGIDDHHTVEDVGIVIGQALRQALGEEPIQRFASTETVMDESLVLVAMDICGRGQSHCELPFKREKIGGLSTECVAEFFRAFAQHAGIALHVRKIAGENDHHLCEAAFKGLGRTLNLATARSSRQGSTSTKGKID